jgi:hypothetical protein
MRSAYAALADANERNTFSKFAPYSGLLWFLFDSVFLACFYIVFLFVIVATPGPHSVVSYLLLSVLLWITLSVKRTIYQIIQACWISTLLYADEDKRRLDLGKVASFAFSAVTFVHPRRGLGGLYESLTRLPFFGALVSVFFGSAAYYIIEVAFRSAYDEWYTTHIQFAGLFKDAACVLKNTSEIMAKVFFAATDETAVIDLGIATGTIGNILMYRYKSRSYYTQHGEDVEKGCNGSHTRVTFESSIAAQMCAGLLAVSVFAVPFVLLKDVESALRNGRVWMAIAIAVMSSGVAIFAMGDIGLETMALLLPGTQWARTYTDLGIRGAAALVTAFTASLFLCLQQAPKELPDADSLQFELNPVQQFVASVGQRWKPILHFLTSETAAMLLCTVCFAFVAAIAGIPVTNVSFVKLPVRFPPPSYMNLNAFERAITSSTSFQGVCFNLLEYLTDSNNQLVEDLLDKIPSFDLGLFTVDLSKWTSVATGPMLTGLKEAEKLLCGALSRATEAAITTAKNAVEEAKGLNVDWLTEVVRLSEFDMDLSAILDEMKDISSQFRTPTLSFLPVVVIVVILASVFLALVHPAIARVFKAITATLLAQVLFWSVAAVLALRQAVRSYGYDIEFEVGQPSVLWFDFVVVVMAVVTVLLLLVFEFEPPKYDAEVQRLLFDFAIDQRVYGSKTRRQR